MIAPITRSLAEGSDYSPDWRTRVIAEYLKKIAAGGEATSFEELLGDERDVVIRQVVRYHLGSSLIPEAIRYALGCQQHNDLTGLASNIRALAMAGLTYDQIANEVGTSRRNIFIFCRLFFDIERYINSESWLESLLRRDLCGGENQAKSRERRLLKSAFHNGLNGIICLLAPRPSRTAEEIQELSDQVRYAVAARAMEYIENLNDGGVPPGPDDFNRHLMVSSSLPQTQTADTNDGGRAAVYAWFKEAGERGIFKDGINEVAIAMGGGENKLLVSNGRRARCLALESTSSERMDGERMPLLGEEDQPMITLDGDSFESQQVESPAD